ncbi:MAG TPA: 2-C-methyl-D-erythritol 2,4-cyclodiphosphate synthase [Chloroflexota bacterium]
MNRIGLGYDIHRVVPGRPMILGGVDIPCPVGPLGHSDSDVLLHALMDSLLGAAALGDIGQHFPPTDPRYAGISSLELLRSVVGLVSAAGFRVENVDMVLVAEQPKLAPYAETIRETVAEVLSVPVSRVSVKATSNEGVGPEGRGEAISAQAVALLRGQP